MMKLAKPRGAYDSAVAPKKKKAPSVGAKALQPKKSGVAQKIGAQLMEAY